MCVFVGRSPDVHRCHMSLYHITSIRRHEAPMFVRVCAVAFAPCPRPSCKVTHNCTGARLCVCHAFYFDCSADAVYADAPVHFESRHSAPNVSPLRAQVHS